MKTISIIFLLFVSSCTIGLRPVSIVIKQYGALDSSKTGNNNAHVIIYKDSVITKK